MLVFLQVLGPQAGITGKACQRCETDFVVIGESERIIRPAGLAKAAMKAAPALGAPTDALKRR